MRKNNFFIRNKKSVNTDNNTDIMVNNKNKNKNHNDD